MKKVLIISTSIRNGSNSEKLARAFLEGAKEKGHEVEFISLKDKNIAFCRGCLACQRPIDASSMMMPLKSLIRFVKAKSSSGHHQFIIMRCLDK